MPRPTENLEKVTIRLFAGDAERLQAYFPTVGYNRAIRTHIHRLLKHLDERTQQAADTKGIDILNEGDINDIAI